MQGLWVVVVLSAAGVALLVVLATVRGRAAVAGVLVVLVVVSGTSLVVFAPSAQAAGACPPGFSLSGTYCLDMAGRYGGYINNGKFYSGGVVPPGHTPAPVNKPSSVLRGANGAGGTVSQNSLRARANGLATKLNLAPRIGQAYMVIQAGQLGFALGKGFAALGCGWGLDALCMPEKAPGFVANADVDVKKDPGVLNNGKLNMVTTDGKAAFTWTVGSDATQTYPITAVYGLHTIAKPGFQAWTAVFIDNGTAPQTANSNQTGDVSFSMGCQVNNAGTVYPLGGSSISQKQWNASDAPANIWSGGSSPRRPLMGTSGNWAVVAGNNTCGGPSNTTVSGVFYKPSTASGVTALPYELVYRLPGDPARAPAVSANPDRTLVTVNTCADGTSLSASSTNFKETDAGFPAYPVAPACQTAALVKVEVFVRAAGLSDKLIWSMNVPEVASAWAMGTGSDAATNQPACAEGICQLKLWKIAGTNKGDCFADVGRCEGWFDDPNKATNYECTYGPAGTYKVVALTECNLYSGTFDPKLRSRGVDYCDPADGKCPDKVGDPGDAGNNGTNGGGSGTDNGNDSGDPSCYPSGWSVFNPVEWIVRPLICVLKFLLIPDTDAISGLSGDLSGAMGGTSLSSWGTSLSGVGNLTGITSGGCGGATIKVPDLGPLKMSGESQSIFDTCQQPWSTVAGVVKALITLMIAWFTVIGCYRILSAAFGLNVPGGSAVAK